MVAPDVPQGFVCTAGHAPLPVRTATGEVHCFNCIVEQYQGQVFNLALGFRHDPALAEDATQETFLSAYRAFGTFRGGSLRAWLLRIAANTCRDMLRAARVRPTTSLEALPLPPEDPDTQSEAPEAYAERQELGRVIREALATLPEEQRLAVHLVDLQGLSYEEAAQALRCNLGTLKSRLARARAALRDRLQAHRELLPAPFRLER